MQLDPGAYLLCLPPGPLPVEGGDRVCSLCSTDEWSCSNFSICQEGTIHKRSLMRIGSNWDCVSCTQFCSAISVNVMSGRSSSPAARAAMATRPIRSSAGSNRATTRLCSQSAVGSSPGSPNCGVSCSVPANASSMLTEIAPCASRASDSASARIASAGSATEIHMDRTTYLPFSASSFSR